MTEYDSMSDHLIPELAQHELDAPPWQRFESTLMNTSKLIRHAFDLELSSVGLNLTQACVLVFVVENGPVTQTKLAEQFSMGRAPVGTIIDYLGERSLMRRMFSAKDRRVWLLSATPEGIELAETIAEIEHEVRRKLRKGSSRDEREQLTRILSRVQWNLMSIIGENES